MNSEIRKVKKKIIVLDGKTYVKFEEYSGSGIATKAIEKHLDENILKECIRITFDNKNRKHKGKNKEV